MARITEKDIRQAVQVLADSTGLPIVVEWAYGKPRLYYRDETRYGAQWELSPRLSTGEMMDWIEAFLKGFEYGQGYRPGSR